MNNQWDVLVKVIELLILPATLWLFRTLASLQAEVRSVKEALIGIDGKNGIRSRVERIETHLFDQIHD